MPVPLLVCDLHFHSYRKSYYIFFVALTKLCPCFGDILRFALVVFGRGFGPWQADKALVPERNVKNMFDTKVFHFLKGFASSADRWANGLDGEV